MEKEKSWFYWYNTQATAEEKYLYEKIMRFEELFGDMMFRKGTATYKMVSCQSHDPDTGEWSDDVVSLPEELEYFSYESFHYRVERQEDCVGSYNAETKTLCISPEVLKDDDSILHELIHLHEDVLNQFPLYFHDVVLWAIYKDLKLKIPELDEIIADNSHMLLEERIYMLGGLHDILFFLKSLDLDIRMGYPLGKVFGYSKQEELSKYNY